MTEEQEEYQPESTEHYPPASEIQMIEKPEDFVPDANFPPDHAWFGKRRCQAWSRRQGRQCLRLAMKGSKACYMHGGATPGGALSPHIKHGRYSKYLPGDLLQKYEDMQEDPELLSLRNEIEMVSARTAQLLEGLKDFPITVDWIKDLQSAYDNFQKGVETQNKQRANRAFDRLGELIQQGANHQQVWKEVGGLFETRKRLANAERERITDANAMWTAEQAMLFVSTLSASFKDVLEKHVENETLRNNILQDLALMIRKLINQSGE